jgi:hypothetical protein
MRPFKPNANFKYYLYWIAERQNIFWRRYNGDSPPYTVDPVLEDFKFTNVYRALDRTSQYLLEHVIYNGFKYEKDDMFWRILLFKHFNLPATWEYLCNSLGDITLDTNIDRMIECLSDRQDRKIPLYSNAYMLTASFMKTDRIKKQWGIEGVTRKHEAYLRIFQRQILDNNLYIRILNAHTFKEAYDLIRTVPTVGDFLAYQYVQDWNYSPLFDFDNNEFCAAGYGTIRGIERTFDIKGPPDYDRIVRWVHVNFRDLMNSSGYRFKPLPNWMPQVPDLSNCFCETDKYLRQSNIKSEGKEIHGKRMKNIFKENNTQIQYVFPPKWNIYI